MTVLVIPHKIYLYLQKWIQEKRSEPMTYEELAKIFGVHEITAMRIIKKMLELNLVEKTSKIQGKYSRIAYKIRKEIIDSIS